MFRIRKGMPMAELTLEREREEEQELPECLRAECTCPDFCERDHDLD